jgi:FKBP-type peptidyl-prolyl cis-trans isomerase FkpA
LGRHSLLQSDEMMQNRCFPFLAIGVLFLAGCDGGGDAPPSAPPDLHASLQLPGDSLELTPSGIWIYDRSEGAGPPATSGDRVTVNYTGWLTTGSRFDASRPGDPLTFRLGAGEVIRGWDLGVAGMRPGGRRMVVIPPHLAYGERGVGILIPPNASLVFEIELVGTEEEVR